MKILFVFPDQSSFILRDLRILRERHDVVDRNIHHVNPFRFLGDVAALTKSDLLFLWFASSYAFPLVLIARLLGKKIVTVVGGYEAVNMPEIDYGAARKPLSRFLKKLLLRLSDRILAVSAASRREIIGNLGISESAITLIYHGFEDIGKETATFKRAVVTSVSGLTQSTWLRKGIYDFVRIAEALPDVSFQHIGDVKSDVTALLGHSLPSNLESTRRVPFDALVENLSAAKVYLQISRHEAFGCSVAEAMLCRCIPVVSNAGALPEVVGDCGIVVESREPTVVAEAVRKALAMPESEGERARQRILMHFSYAARRDRLLEIVESIDRE